MASKVRYKLNEIVWITTLFCIVVLVQSRPQTETSFIEGASDPSDRTLIRVLRSEFDKEEKGGTALKARKTRKVETHFPPVKKRASEEEDQFFQALLSRTQDKPLEKRSYEAQPEKDDVRMNWKGDSKISDADKKELEHLFNSIGMVEDEASSKGKTETKRSTGNDGKVQDLVEWLMSKPPKEFHDSLRHIIDVERQISDIFGGGDANASPTTSEAVVTEPSATTTETSSENVPSSVVSTGTSSDSASVPPSVTSQTTASSPVVGSFTSLPGQVASPPPPSVSAVSQSVVPGIAQPSVVAQPSIVSQPAVSSVSQPAVSGVSQPAVSGGAQPQTLANDMATETSSAQTAPQSGGKKQNLYAEVMKASKTLAQTGPGPIPIEAMNYFNKFGGVGSVSPQVSTAGPQAAAPGVQQVPAVLPQQAPMVLQPVTPQQNVQQYNQQQQQQQALRQQQQQQLRQQHQQQQYAQQQAAYQFQQDQRQRNPYYNHMYKQPRPYVSRNGNYRPPEPRPYPLHQDELDKSTGKKKSVTASLLFKQSWSDDFEKRKSTRFRVFRTEAKRELNRVFETKKNFDSISIDKIREERGKVDVKFTINFKKETKYPLRPLYEQIARDYLGNMPVYRDTLIRGEKHSPRMAPVRTATKMEKSQSENPATEFAQFADEIDREKTGANLPLTEKHAAYQGCFKDRKPHRDMKKHFSKFEMTPEWCLHTCKKEGYRFAGVQYSYLCFCGNKFGKYGRVPDSECSSRCYGDKNRFCGAFWHNSIYSVDGQRHNPDEFSALQDDDEDEDDERSEDKHEDENKKDEKSEKDDEKEHAEVANHLMKAASSALKAAKKLLPSGKDKRQISSEDLARDKEDAEKALKAVDKIVEVKKNVDKRSADSSDGRNLLMSYLGNVGGYDREYRSVEDENKPVDKLKFEYKREIIDEEGDGEFVSKPRDKNVLKRSRRSLEPEDFDGRKKMALRAMSDNSDATNPKSAVAEPSRRELLTKDTSEKEITRRSRDVDDEEEEEEEEEDREMMKTRKKRKTEKRSVGFDKSLYHSKVQEGIENIIGGVLEVMKESTSIGSFKEDIEKLATDVANGLAIPPEQKDQVTTEIRQDIKETGTSSVNNLITSIRTELNEYGEMHPAVGPQAEEAAHTFSDLPLDVSKAEEIKKKIRKRSLDENDEGEQEFLSDILKEHFKQNP